MSNSGKIQDAASAALTAVEAALDVKTASSDESDLRERAGLLDDSLGNNSSDYAASGSSSLPPVNTPELTPANDDRRSVGALRQALNIAPNHSIMALTIVSMAFWAICWTFYIYFNKSDIVDPSGALLSPKLVLALGALIGPIAFLFITGLMARRAHEMRLIANSMTEVAIRLIEPETIATEQVVSLSQAIRREAASMGDGIERALTRAGELEVIVRTEVTNLERSYTENERRIRLLIDELTREREAIIVNADNARTALFGARDALSQELAASSIHLAEAVSAAGERVTSSLGLKSDEIRLALEKASDEFESSLEAHGRVVSHVLSEAGSDVVARMNDSSDVLSLRFSQGVDDAARKLYENGEALTEVFVAQGEAIVQRFEGLGSSLTDSLTQQGESLTLQLAQAHDVIHETIATRGGELEQSLAQTSNRLLTGVGAQIDEAQELFEKSEARLLNLMEQSQEQAKVSFEQRSQLLGQTLTESLTLSAAALVEQVDSVKERFFSVASEAVSAIGVHGDQMSEAIVGSLQQFEDVALRRGDEIANRIAERGEYLEQSLAEKINAFEEVVSRNSHETVTRLAEQSDRVTVVMSEGLSAFEAAVSDQSEETSSRIQACSDQAYASLSERLIAFEDAVRRYHEESLSYTDQTTKNLNEEIKSYVDAIRHHSQLASEKLIDHSRDVEGALGSGLAAFEEKIIEKTEQVGLHLLNHSTIAQEELMTHLNVFEGAVNHHSEQVNSAVSEHVRRVESLLSERMQMLENAGSMVAQAMEGTRDQALKEFEAHGEALRENIRQTVVSASQALSENSAAVQEQFAATASDAVLALATQGERLNEVLGDRLNNLDSSVFSQGKEVVESLVDHGAKITTILSGQLNQLEQTFVRDGEALVERVAEQTTYFTDNIHERLNKLESVISGDGSALIERLSERIQEADVRLNEQSQKFIDRVDTSLSDIKHTVSQGGETLVNELAVQVDNFNNRIGDNSRHFSQEIGARLEALDEAVSMRGSDIMHAVEARLDQIDILLNEKGGALVEKLDDRTKDLAVTLSQKIDSFEASGVDRVSETVERLEQLAKQLSEGLGSGGRRLEESLVKHAIEIARIMGTGGRDVVASLNEKLKELEDTLSVRADTFVEHLDSKAFRIDAALDGHATAFEESIERLEKNVVDRLGVVSLEIDEKGSRIAETIDARLQDINQILSDARSELDTTLRGHAGELGHNLVDRISQISEELSVRLSQMEHMLHERGGSVTRELEAAGNLAAQTIESRGALIIRELAQKRDELTHALQESHASLNLALDEGAHDSIKSLIAMNEKIRQEMPNVLEKLGVTNASLHEIMDQTGGGLIHLERELSERVYEFQQALTEVSGQVRELSSISGETMQDAHKIVAALEERQVSLSQSAQKLTESQRALDLTFDQRKSSLDQLVLVLDAKRSEFERSMGGFVDSMVRSVHAVESRAQDIGGVISVTTDQAAQLIEERFAHVRAAAENERAQTAQSLRVAFSEATDEINLMFSETQKKFQIATGEIRGLAKEIHQELEATREELRRGASELPREAAEQSAAFRRVVTDQVKSLADLTDMMARTGRSIETADTPSRRSSEPARIDASRARMTPPPIPQRAKSEPQGGWLSDLLERASRDESVAPAPINNGGALERLTLDIARLVDDLAVSEAWRRYQRGEKGGLFSRRLYTQQGRQTFEEISRRYRVDQNFRTAMDQYIRNFEERVVETTRNDRDGSRTLALLTADAGKVYTMLGHAAGRFD